MDNMAVHLEGREVKAGSFVRLKTAVFKILASCAVPEGHELTASELSLGYRRGVTTSHGQTH